MMYVCIIRMTCVCVCMCVQVGGYQNLRLLVRTFGLVIHWGALVCYYYFFVIISIIVSIIIIRLRSLIHSLNVYTPSHTHIHTQTLTHEQTHTSHIHTYTHTHITKNRVVLTTIDDIHIPRCITAKSSHEHKHTHNTNKLTHLPQKFVVCVGQMNSVNDTEQNFLKVCAMVCMMYDVWLYGCMMYDVGCVVYDGCMMYDV